MLSCCRSVIGMEAQEHWIFYLKLTRDLPREFLLLDHEFKKNRKSLIPVTLKTLLECTRKNKSIHVLIVVKSFGEYRYFHHKVKKILKYLMRTEKVNLYVASSFGIVNDPSIMKRNYYEFIKLPVNLKQFCGSISELIDSKEMQYNSWPGGVRPRLSLAG